MLDICSKTTFSHYTFKTFFKNFLSTLLRTDTRVIIKQTNFSKLTNPKAIFKNEQVSKSPWKTTDGKGASTFPFHNLPPYSETLEKRSFSILFNLSFWIKEKSVATLASATLLSKKA